MGWAGWGPDSPPTTNRALSEHFPSGGGNTHLETEVKRGWSLGLTSVWSLPPVSSCSSSPRSHLRSSCQPGGQLPQPAAADGSLCGPSEQQPPPSPLVSHPLGNSSGAAGLLPTSPHPPLTVQPPCTLQHCSFPHSGTAASLLGFRITFPDSLLPAKHTASECFRRSHALRGRPGWEVCSCPPPAEQRGPVRPLTCRPTAKGGRSLGPLSADGHPRPAARPRQDRGEGQERAGAVARGRALSAESLPHVQSRHSARPAGFLQARTTARP